MTRNRCPRPSRGLAGTLGALALTGLLASAGCGTGQLAQTADQQSAVNGTFGQVGDVAIRDARIVYPEHPAGPDALYRQGGTAPLGFLIVNEGATADRLVRVSTPAAASVAIGGNAALPKDVGLLAGPAEEAPPAGVRAVDVQLTGLTAPVRAGVPIPVTFTFERAGTFTAQLPADGPGEGGEPERVDSEEAHGEAAPAAPGQPAEPGGGH